MDTMRSLFTWIYGILFIVLMFPFTCLIWLVTLPFDSDRRMVHRWLLFQGIFMVRTCPLWRTVIEGREKIVKGEAYVMISNHQSIIDILLVNTLGNSFRWVSKTENYRVPILSTSMRLAKYIEIERGNKESVIKMMDLAKASLGKGISVMMFPEGTRSRGNDPGPFKTGAFQLALEAGRPILPIVLDGTGKVLPKRGLKFSSGHRLRLKVLDPVYPADFGSSDPETLAITFHDAMRAALEDIRGDKKPSN
jgi:1-acyl-sn-glycerol-3-phosphate acyltransferase